VKTLKQNIGQKGAAAVEFAIIVPLLLTLVFGIIEFSILFYNKAMLTNASREAARTGIVYDYPDRPTDPEIENVVTTYCGNNLITFGTNVPPDVSISRSGSEAGDTLTVTVDYHYDFLVLPNFIASLVGGTDLSAVTVMRME
jgi:Flp pilus assembly protein TadG